MKKWIIWKNLQKSLNFPQKDCLRMRKTYLFCRFIWLNRYIHTQFYILDACNQYIWYLSKVTFREVLMMLFDQPINFSFQCDISRGADDAFWSTSINININTNINTNTFQGDIPRSADDVGNIWLLLHHHCLHIIQLASALLLLEGELNFNHIFCTVDL